ncbi:hypothetical protein JHK84_044825 [Glycine max]|nr:hypothetical protein JHK86_044717 [Glycine max]KAG4951461.1 hypothetical protein JHK85_045328 [Glycine max]KAG5107918.1 hypothetical protein JHK84_044825 [Glycine max]
MAFPSKGDDEQVLVQRKSNARVLTLNRTKQLNALSFYMVSRLLEIFSEDEKDSDIKLVVVKGNGRAFCAGGDVAAVARDGSKGDWRFGANFFQSEFKLNYLMATYSKPQVSILNGIVMGGGAGVSVHGRFRVVTENTVFAMPETALGLFPDIGSSYFLSRLPGFLGEYAGLTGARLDGAEMLACGLATHFVPSSKLSLLEEALCKVETSDPNAVSAIINKYSEQPFLKEDSVYHSHNRILLHFAATCPLSSVNLSCLYQLCPGQAVPVSTAGSSAFVQLDLMDVINKCFSKKAVEEILSSLEVEATRKADPWISATIQSLKKASPTSLKIFLRSIRQGRLQGVGQCLVSDYRVVCHILKGHYSKDFFEGCRAILIDKDRNPKWEPSKLELLSDSDVNRYFSKLDDKGWKDLELPKRFNNLPTYAISKL